MSDWKPPEELCRIVCAANIYRGGGFFDGLMIVGPRHWDPVMRESVRRICKMVRWDPQGLFNLEWEQGFIDQWGRFWNRQQAWKIAERQGQILFRCGGDQVNGGTLYSENLY